MGKIGMPGGGGGADTSVVTAAAGDVLSGKVIVDKDGNPVNGSLSLSGNAAAGDVLSGKTFYNTDAKTKGTGTMTNHGAVAPAALGAGGSYTIPAGYHNGSGKVTVQSLATLTASGDATAAQILSGKKAYVDGSLITGTMPNYHTNQAASSGQNPSGIYYYFAPGYYNYDNENPWVYRPLSDFGNATAAQVLSGKTFTSTAGKAVSGTLAVTSAISFSATAQSATVIRISWTNPSKGPWEGVFIQMSTSGNPGVSGGTRAYTGRGNSTTAGGSNYVDITGLKPGTTYYFTCTSYATGLGNGASSNVSAKTSGLVLYWDGSAPYSMTNSDPNNNTITFNSTNIQFTRKTESGGLFLRIVTGNLSLSSYSKLCISYKITAATTSTIYIYTCYQKQNSSQILIHSASKVTTTSSSTYAESDISTLSYAYGAMAIRIESMSEGGGNSGASGYVYRIWLE